MDYIMKAHPIVVAVRKILGWIIILAWFGAGNLVYGELTALPSLQNWTANSRTSLVEELARTQNVKIAGDELKSWLINNYKSAFIANKSACWSQVLGLYKWQKLRQEINGAPEAAWNWLMTDQALTDEFFQNLSPRDDAGRVICILDDIHQKAPDKFPAYNSLALAFALVWDNPPPLKMHNQIGSASVPQDSSTVAERFLFYVNSNEKNILEWDLRKLPAEHLEFVVDSAVSLDELSWAQKHVRARKGTYDTVFASIKYDERRLKTGVFTWPFPIYSLAEIQKRGGICVDQAYFAALSGKANGIPTLFFDGSGRRGDHAWFGYLKGKDKWDMDCGRYTYDKYATGFSRDPQTGQDITDHELDYLSKNFRNGAAYQSARLMADAARLMAESGDIKSALSAVDDALKQENRDYETWLLKESLLKDEKQAADMEQFYTAMGQRFENYPDLKVQTQEKLMALHEAQGETNETKKIRQSIISRNARNRTDLSLDIMGKSIQDKVEANDYPGALKEFKSAIQKFSGESGPMLNLLQSFVDSCLAKNERKTAADAIRYFKNRIVLDGATKNKFDKIEQRVNQNMAQ